MLCIDPAGHSRKRTTRIATLLNRLQELDRHLAAVGEQHPQVALLRTIPGIGLLNATALVACVGDVRRFPSGRHFASYLGLTPREHSSGGRRRLGGISKQGDQYLRTLLIHAARGTLSHSFHPDRATPFRRWARAVAERRGGQHRDRGDRQSPGPDGVAGLA